MIRLEHFSKSYNAQNKNPAVKDVSFVAEDCSITGLLGLNGAGKTTVLKAVCALHYPSSGSVFVSDLHNRTINVAENPAEAKKNTGYLSEHPYVYGDFSVFEFLKFSGEIYGNKIDYAVHLCNLESVMEKKIASLSKGFMQRVSFARLIIQDSPVMLLDEPSDGLDPAQNYKMKKIIAELAKSKTILFSTHNILEAETLCSKICILSGGVLVAEGSASELTKNSGVSDFEHAFLKITGSKI